MKTVNTFTSMKLCHKLTKDSNSVVALVTKKELDLDIRYLEVIPQHKSRMYNSSVYLRI